MLRTFFPKFLTVLTTLAVAVLVFVALRTSSVIAQTADKQGSLQVLGPEGKPNGQCPLRHTSVKAEISGFLSRVVVTQEFENVFKEKIEAVYTFPLPQNAAVDDMTMVVGERTVRGKILKREEAQAVYEAAKSAGHVASLLDQERPNIFTQSVANILPGEHVKVTISYVETLKYEAGTYEFVFPMVVGPRYVPGAAKISQGSGFSSDTDRVPDGSRITPWPVPEGMRAGHDISIEINLDSGLAIDGLASRSHEIDVERSSVSRAAIKLKNSSVIPNKDFILRYKVAGKGIDDVLLTHRAGKGGFFSLILQPPERVTVEDVSPKELVFVLDTSGSMSGFPIEKAKETMKLALDNLYPADTFNLITFAGDTRILFPEPVPATSENLRKAQRFLAQSSGYGGTEMMKAIKASLDPSDAQKHIRVVCFMTDGYVGNDMEILSEVRKHPNARVFAFGIGSSVNRFLLDKMADQGRGEVEYVGLSDDGSAAARRFHERVRNPLLTDISVDWNGLPVADIYPQRIPDLFGAKPVILTGRFTGAGRGTLRLRGRMSGRDFVREIPVEFPESQAEHDVLASLWARNRVDDLMSQDYAGAQEGTMQKDLKDTVTQLGLEYRLMTQFTSFVAVEEMIVTEGGQSRRIDVPIEVPEGVDRSAIFGEEVRGMHSLARIAPRAFSSTVNVMGSGRGGGIGSGSGSGASGPRPKKASAPPPPNAAPTVSITALERAEFSRQLSPEEEKRVERIRKLNPALLALTERIKKPEAKPSAEEARFVHDGKVELQVWLTEKTTETMTALREIGFEVVLDPKTSKLVIGRLPLENLEKLADLKFVRYVAPQVSRN